MFLNALQVIQTVIYLENILYNPQCIYKKICIVSCIVSCTMWYSGGYHLSFTPKGIHCFFWLW